MTSFLRMLMFEILTNSLPFFLHLVMMKCLSKDGTTMFLLSHLISFPPVTTQRIKEYQDSLHPSSSELERVDRPVDTRALGIKQNAIARLPQVLKEVLTAKASWSDVYFSHQGKNHGQATLVWKGVNSRGVQRCETNQKQKLRS